MTLEQNQPGKLATEGNEELHLICTISDEDYDYET